MMTRGYPRLLLAAAIVLTFAGSAHAQGMGSIFGKVTDATGAVMPGVTVTVTGTGLQRPRVAVTTDTGAYQFPNVPIGTYTVTFELEGFKKAVRSDIVLVTGQNAGIDQKLGRIDLARAHHEHQRRFAFRVRRIGIHTCRQQLADHGLRADQSGFGHRRHAEHVLGSSVGASFDQALDHDRVAIACRPHQRRRAEGIGRVHICAALDEADGLLAVPGADGVDQRICRRTATGSDQ